MVKNMIYIGVTGWGDHHSLYEHGVPAHRKLEEYSAHFPIVEVDATFYAIQSHETIKKWVKQTPDSFCFIVKAYQEMTGHMRGESSFTSKQELFDTYIQSIEPFITSGKLAMVLFQFPPWFDCRKENVNYLRYCKEKMQGIPVALEFRNQSWFDESFYQSTLQFMESEGWIHSVCDEPQIPTGSVPTVLHATHPDKTLIRMHGRNRAAWLQPSADNWREIRYLYRYNKEELIEWKSYLATLSKQSKELYIVFNNNSGGDAAPNAKELIDLLGIEYQDLSSLQLGLF